jgi:hypothetical protein
VCLIICVLKAKYGTAVVGFVAAVPRHNIVLRGTGAVVFGLIAGLFLWAAVQVGLRYHYIEEQRETSWGIFFWGEHWALRTAASWAATAGAGYLTGVVARRRGAILAVISALPSAFCWLGIAILAWHGPFSFMGEVPDFHVSIGNKLAASLLALTTFVVAAWAGGSGAQEGETYGPHFDARRFSLLGIKWYHYLWLPLVVYLWLIQMSWAVFYGLEWLKIAYKSGASFLSIVPGVFTMMIWGTLAIMGNGAAKAYAVLAGFQFIPTVRGRAFAVLMYGVGAFVLAAILQIGIQLLQYGLARLLGYA